MLISKNDTSNIYNNRLFIGQHKHYINFGLILKPDWNIIRLLWIGYLKNTKNDLCYFKNLSKDVILLIIDLLKLSFFNLNDSNIIAKMKNLKDPLENYYGSSEDEDEHDGQYWQ